LVSIAHKSLIAAIGCKGLVWAISDLQRDAVDEYREVEAFLLHFNSFNSITATAALDSQGVQGLSPCDTHCPECAVLLLEMPVADSALRSRASREFDKRTRSRAHGAF
jgi:hypothetical protein